LNKKLLVNQIATGTFAWIQSQMNYIAIIVMFASSMTVITFKHNIDSVILALVFQYTLSMQNALTESFNNLSNLEMNLVGIQRCIQITSIPSENFGQPEIDINRPM